MDVLWQFVKFVFWCLVFVGVLSAVCELWIDPAIKRYRGEL